MSGREERLVEVTTETLSERDGAPMSGAERRAYVRALAQLIFAERQERERLAALRKVGR